MKKYLAYDIGGTNTRLSLVNKKFEIEKQLIIPTLNESKEAFVNNVFEVTDKLGIDWRDVLCAGCGLPGVIDKEKNYIIDLPNVFIKDIPLGELFEQKYNKKIYLGNDAEMAALAEANLGNGKGKKRTFFITISTGLGGALCVDGYVAPYVTEIGHTIKVYKGNVTEYEKVISGRGIINLCKYNNIEIATSRSFFERVRNNDPQIMPIYDEWLNLLSEFLQMVQNSYYPDVICFTGGVFKAKDVFFDELKRRNPNCQLVECKFKEDAGTIGSAIYAFQCSNIDKK